jgi:hypothetical protein
VCRQLQVTPDAVLHEPGGGGRGRAAANNKVNIFSI